MFRKLIGTSIGAMVVVPGLSAFTVGEESGGREGKDLFRDYCAMCHRLDAKGMCMAPSLIGVTDRMSTKEIAAHARTIADEIRCARSIKRLTDRDFVDIVEYLKTLPDQQEGQNATTKH